MVLGGARGCVGTPSGVRRGCVGGLSEARASLHGQSASPRPPRHAHAAGSFGRRHEECEVGAPYGAADYNQLAAEIMQQEQSFVPLPVAA